jgi:predicted DNA-binding transcriptional regulator YafY
VPSFPLHNEAKSAFRKLAFDLDPAAFDKQSPVLFADRPQSDDVAGHLRVLSKALLARKRVQFRYHGIYRGEATERDVDGYGLLFQGGQWYLIGFDRLRDDMRVFRVGRMADVAANKASPNTPDYQVPADFDLSKYAGRQPWELGEGEEQPITARVRFNFPLSLWAERNQHGVEESRNAHGDVVRLFTVHQTNPFLRWLLGLQQEVEILDPPELRAELRAMAQKILAAHREDTHGGR